MSKIIRQRTEHVYPEDSEYRYELRMEDFALRINYQEFNDGKWTTKSSISILPEELEAVTEAAYSVIEGAKE